ncbi:hypothetical protein MHBO_005307 [Bonamia ostreae]|uniref:Uncharacterized protein n=1 Tax=Bonamia ostreae TaxID=126728 RepID=A0ABV2AGL9_9EUKA
MKFEYELIERLLARSIKISPDKDKIAILTKKEKKFQLLIFKDMAKICELHLNSGTVKNVEWSYDSCYLAVFQKMSNFVEIVNIQNEKIEKFHFGQTQIFGCLAKTDNYLLTISEFALKMTISIIGKKIRFFIEMPKFKNKNCFDFSQNGKFLVVAERNRNKDKLFIYDINNLFKLYNEFEVSTEDLSIVKMTNETNLVSVLDWEFNNQSLVYSTEGELIFKTQSNIPQCPSFKNLICSPQKDKIMLFSNKSLTLIEPLKSDKPILNFSFSDLAIIFKSTSYQIFIQCLYIEVPWDYVTNETKNLSFNNDRTKYTTNIDKTIAKFYAPKINYETISQASWSKDSRYFSVVLCFY